MTISKMSNDELVRAIAEEVMGWRDCGEYYSHKINPAKIIFTKETTSFLSAWQPLTDYNQTFQVVERMRELGFNFCLICRQDGVDATCFTKSHNFSGETKTENFRHRIILEAALEAVRGKK